MTARANRNLLIVPALGAVLWLVAVWLREPGLTRAMLWLGVLVVTPLALHVSQPGRLVRLAIAAALPAGALLVLFELPHGLQAAPWFGVTLLVATRGVMLALTRKPGRGTLRAAGYGFLAVGGGWTWAEAAGVYFGFGPVIALLTGVHFHYAGLAMQVLAWRAAGTRAGLVAGWGVTVGTPLVGVSFLVSPWASLGSTLVLAAAGVLLALVQARLALGLARPVARALLWVSSGSFMAGMALAAAYAAGVALETYWLSIPTMARTHGLLNGVGFTLCALLAHTLNPAARARG